MYSTECVNVYLIVIQRIMYRHVSLHSDCHSHENRGRHDYHMRRKEEVREHEHVQFGGHQEAFSDAFGDGEYQIARVEGGQRDQK